MEKFVIPADMVQDNNHELTGFLILSSDSIRFKSNSRIMVSYVCNWTQVELQFTKRTQRALLVFRREEKYCTIRQNGVSLLSVRVDNVQENQLKKDFDILRTAAYQQEEAQKKADQLQKELAARQEKELQLKEQRAREEAERLRREEEQFKENIQIQERLARMREKRLQREEEARLEEEQRKEEERQQELARLEEERHQKEAQAQIEEELRLRHEQERIEEEKRTYARLACYYELQDSLDRAITLCPTIRITSLINTISDFAYQYLGSAQGGTLPYDDIEAFLCHLSEWELPAEIYGWIEEIIENTYYDGIYNGKILFKLFEATCEFAVGYGWKDAIEIDYADEAYPTSLEQAIRLQEHYVGTDLTELASYQEAVALAKNADESNSQKNLSPVQQMVVDYALSLESARIDVVFQFIKEIKLSTGSILNEINALNSVFVMRNRNELIQIDEIPDLNIVAHQIEQLIKQELAECGHPVAIRDLQSVSQFPSVSIPYDEWFIYSMLNKWGNQIHVSMTNAQFRFAIPVVSIGATVDAVILKQIAEKHQGNIDITGTTQAVDLDNLDDYIADMIDLDDLIDDDFLFDEE